MSPNPTSVPPVPPPSGARGDRPGTRAHRRRAVVLLTALMTACSPRDAVTAPVGPEAAEVTTLWWFILGLGAVVWVAVMALVAVPLVRSWRHRRRGGVSSPSDQAADPHEETAPSSTAGAGAQPATGGLLSRPPAAAEDEPLVQAPDADDLDPDADRRVRSRLLWLGGIILPVAILAVLLVATSMTGASVSHVAGDDDLEIDVIGHMFWWEVHYPGHDVVTANEIHVPVDQRVRLNLRTEDVIHSFWIPRVHGKVDLIPGTDNLLTFTVEEPGRYRGQCAEYCGIAHAQMAKHLVAQQPDDFDAWVAAQQQEATAPESEERRAGREAFLEHGCADCHGVTGHGATGGVGPDLTHLASRDRLAAGIIENTRENLAELILDPSEVKPGNPMPPTDIDEDDLEVLLDYLEGLE